MSWIDIAIIALVVLCGLFGLLRGFKKSLLSLGAFIIAFVLALFLSNVIAEALLGVDAVKGFVLGNGAFEEEFSLANLIYNGLGDNNGGISSDSFLGQNFFAPIEQIISNSTVSVDPVQGKAMYMAFLMFSAICGVGIFIIVRFLLMIVTAIIKSYIGKKKTIGSRLFGFLVSAVQGAVIAFAITIIFTCFGGLTFMPGVDIVENEYESPNAVLATPVYKGAYAIRNSLFLPDEGMYGRIVNLVIQKDYEDPDTEQLTGERLKLFINVNNLNYNNNPWSIDEITKKRVFDSNTANARVASDFSNIGFDGIMQSILDYNKNMSDIIDNTDMLTELTENDFQALNTLMTGISNSFDKLVLNFGAYTENYNSRRLIDPNDEDADKQFIELNNTLQNDYVTIKATLDELKSKLADVEQYFGESPEFETVPDRVNAEDEYVPEQGGDNEEIVPPEQDGDGEEIPPEQGGDGENGGNENEPKQE